MTAQAKDPTLAMRCPVATGFVRHRQPRQAEGGTIRKGARRPGHESRDPVAAQSSGEQ